MPCLFLTLDHRVCPLAQQGGFLAALQSQLGLRPIPGTRSGAQGDIFAFEKSPRQPSWIRAALDVYDLLNKTFGPEGFHTGLSLSDGLEAESLVALPSKLGAQLIWPGMTQMDKQDLSDMAELPGDLNLDFENRALWPLATQSVLDLKTQTILYSEVLARSTDLDLGSASFVPGLEAGGQIAALDKEVIQRALTALAESPDLRLGVNASRLSVLDADWLAGFDQIDAPEIGHRLFIEITETFTNPPDQRGNFVAALEHLKQKGVQLVLDDLGRGVTSLSELVALPFDFVKLDRNLIQTLVTQKTDYDFLADLQTISQSQPWEIIAEGASDATTYAFIQGSGVAFAQGFAIDRPEISKF